MLTEGLRMPRTEFCGKARASRPSESCLSIQDVLDLTQNTLAIVTVSEYARSAYHKGNDNPSAERIKGSSI
jgi:hypothetical protein